MTRRAIHLLLLAAALAPAQSTQPVRQPATQPAGADLAVLRDETELKGSIRLEGVRLRSPLGEFDLPPQKLRALQVASGPAGSVTLALTDGQLLRGTWLGEPMRIILPGGEAVTLPFSRVVSVAFAVDAPTTAPDPQAVPHVLFRDGQRLSLASGPLPAEFHTRYGLVAFAPADVSRFEFTADDLEAEGTLHRLVLRNGTTLTGLLRATELTLPLQLGPAVTVPRGELARLVLHPVDFRPASGEWAVTLRNGDRLVGQLRSDRLTLLGELGEVRVPLDSLQHATPLDDGKLEVAQFQGPTLRGVLVGEPVVVELPGGQTLRIPPGDIRTLAPRGQADLAAQARPPAGPTSRPTSTPTASNHAERNRERAKLDETLRRLGVEIGEYEKVIMALDANIAKFAKIRAGGGNFPAEMEQKLQEHRRKMQAKLDAVRQRQADLRKQRADLNRPNLAPTESPTKDE